MEVRRKRTYVKRDVLEEQARKQQEELDAQRSVDLVQQRAEVERVEQERKLAEEARIKAEKEQQELEARRLAESESKRRKDEEARRLAEEERRNKEQEAKEKAAKARLEMDARKAGSQAADHRPHPARGRGRRRQGGERNGFDAARCTSAWRVGTASRSPLLR